MKPEELFYFLDLKKNIADGVTERRNLWERRYRSVYVTVRSFELLAELLQANLLRCPSYLKFKISTASNGTKKM